MGALHVALSWPLIGASAAVAIWALAAHWRENLRSGPLWIATAVVQVLLGVQSLMGAIAVAIDGREASQGHVFYGFLVTVAIGILYGYRRQLADWQYLLYGLGGFFVTGLALRAHFLDAWAAA